MDYKKYIPHILIGLVFLIVLLVLVDVKAGEILPSLLGFIIGGALTFFIIIKIKSR